MGKPVRLNGGRLASMASREPAEVKHLSKRRKREKLFIPLVAASEKGRAQTYLVLCTR